MPTTTDTNPTLDPDEQKTASDDTRLIESPIPPCSIVIFGATGDLTHRKLIPALFSLETQGLLPDKMKIVGFARRDFSDHSFREELQCSIEEFAPDLWKESQDTWHKFARRIVFHRSDFDNAQGFTWLKERLDKFDQSEGTSSNRLYYLATPPSTYTTVIQQLGKGERFRPRFKAATFNARIFQHRVHQVQQPLAAARDTHERLTPCFRRRRPRFQQPDLQAHGGDGRAQLMGHDAQEVSFHAAGAFSQVACGLGGTQSRAQLALVLCHLGRQQLEVGFL